MATAAEAIEHERITLGGVEYVVVRAARFDALCAAAARAPTGPDATESLSPWAGQRQTIARRLMIRRKRLGLSQAELARRAGVRAETLNRIERGKVDPDFATIRKLAVALRPAAAD